MPRFLQNTFLLLFSAILVYGAWLYGDVFVQSGFVKRLKWEKQFAPAEFSTAYEQEFTQFLSKKRHPIITSLATFKWEALDLSFIQRVEKGRDGWLFLKEEVPGRNELLQSLGIRPYTNFELKMWSLLIEQRAEWTSGLGMKYVLLIVPNKASIYPEYLPARDHRVAPRSTLKLLRHLSGVEVIDLTSSVFNQKGLGQLYHKYDTHWNELGAFAAYQGLMRALPAPFNDAPLPLDSFIIDQEIKRDGDLARMMLMDSSLSERVPRLKLRQQRAQCRTGCNEPFEPFMSPKLFSNPQARLSKVFFDHDSFFKALAPFVAEHFQASFFSWQWQGFHWDVIESERPALVVDEFVERSLIGDRPRNSPPILQAYWQKHFQDLPEVRRFEAQNLRQAFRQIESIRLESDAIPVVQLELQPSTAAQLLVEYDDKVISYPLEANQPNTIFLEWEPLRMKDLRLEQGGTVSLSVQVRKY